MVAEEADFQQHPSASGLAQQLYQAKWDSDQLGARLQAVDIRLRAISGDNSAGLARLRETGDMPELPVPATESVAGTDPAAGVLALIDRLKGTESVQEAGPLIAAVFTADTGVLARVQEFAEAGAEWVRDNAPDSGLELHDWLDEASADLHQLAETLADVPAYFTTLTVEHQPACDRANAARSTSTPRPLPAQTRPTTPPPAAPVPPNTPTRRLI
ncbi:hypothetical protein [Kitasatospora sp. HPMI-4]|uniref:hypothetical protein n=1 Tax=Kitasatospora sp. HPMI-4 TaxID=3448443 RepID=UPI003F1D044A